MLTTLALALLAWTTPQELSAPSVLDDGWPVAAPGEVGLDASILGRLAAKVRADSWGNVHAVLLAKDGRLVFEEYFEGPDEDWGQDLGVVAYDVERLHDLRSVTKSVTAALVGIALEKQRGFALERPVFKLLGEKPKGDARAKLAITLEHVLTMSAGLAWDESLPYDDPRNSEIRMIQSPNAQRYVLARELVEPPGSRFEYSGGLTQLLAGVVEEAGGERLDAFAREHLFEPLGIDRLEWHRHSDGSHSASSGLRLTPRDLAKFGALFLDRGRWRDVQVLPEAWIEASLRPAIEAYPARSYGYQWWVTHLVRRDEALAVPTAIGNGGQRIFVLRDLELLVVITAGLYNRPTPVSDRVLTEWILPAAGQEGWILRPAR